MGVVVPVVRRNILWHLILLHSIFSDAPHLCPCITCAPEVFKLNLNHKNQTYTLKEKKVILINKVMLCLTTMFLTFKYKMLITENTTKRLKVCQR